jgi:very-short-patch-repair endonuclease
MKDRLRFTSPNAGRSASRRATRDGATGGGTGIPRARALRKTATDAERLLWSSLRALKQQGLHFRRQAPIGPYITDFACHRSKIVVELDGSQHGTDENVRRDAVRTAFLTSRGYRVMRFPNEDVFKDLHRIVEGIVLHAESPHPPRTS